jgi:hypothetical protein
VELFQRMMAMRPPTEPRRWWLSDPALVSPLSLARSRWRDWEWSLDGLGTVTVLHYAKAMERRRHQAWKGWTWAPNRDRKRALYPEAADIILTLFGWSSPYATPHPDTPLVALYPGSSVGVRASHLTAPLTSPGETG